MLWFIHLFPRKDRSTEADYNLTYYCEWGLCNQLMSLISGIFHARRNKTVHNYKNNQWIMVDCFCCGIDTGNVIQANRIIDFDAMNKLYADDRIQLVDRSVNPFNSADWTRYGTAVFNWYIFYETEFTEILCTLRFCDPWNCMVQEILSDCNIHAGDTVHCMHMRFEEDGIANWCKSNNMTHSEFVMTLKNLYERICTKYIVDLSGIATEDSSVGLASEDSSVGLAPEDIKSRILICAETIPTEMHSFLEEHFNIVQIDKAYYLKKYGIPLGREVNGLIDLLVASKLKGTVIGCQNPRTGWGSSFSLFLRLMTSTENLKVMIDLDHIHEPEEVYYTLDNMKRNHIIRRTHNAIRV